MIRWESMTWPSYASTASVAEGNDSIYNLRVLRMKTSGLVKLQFPSHYHAYHDIHQAGFYCYS